MSTVVTPQSAPAAAKIDTVADLLRQLGDIPPERVLWDPIPGTATEADVMRELLREWRVHARACALAAHGGPPAPVPAFLVGDPRAADPFPAVKAVDEEDDEGCA